MQVDIFIENIVSGNKHISSTLHIAFEKKYDNLLSSSTLVINNLSRNESSKLLHCFKVAKVEENESW